MLNKKLVRKVLFSSIIMASSIAMTGNAVADDNDIKVGFIAPTKTLIGSQMVKGAEYAANEVNKDGGILGKNIKLIIYDTNLNPAEGANVANRLVTHDDIKYVAGEVSSSVNFAINPIFNRGDVLFIAGIPKHPDLTTKSGYPEYFRLNSTTDMDANALEGDLKKRFGDKKIAIVNENTDFGLEGRKNLREIFNKKDQIVFDKTFDVTESDFSVMANNLKRSGADVLCITATNPEHYGNLIRMAAEAGYKPDICLMPGILYQEALQITGPAADGAISADIYEPSIDNPQNKSFVEGYTKVHGSDHEPDKAVLLGYEGIKLIADGINKTGSADSTQDVAKTLRSNTWETPRGELKFDENGQATTKFTKLLVKDGKITIFE